jgi:phosphatidylserine/phosphatidylglycerophosphate/cardiolipin synthase-like enzyme
MNMSATSIDKNREIGIILMQPEHIRYFNAVFAKDRKGSMPK